MSGLVGHLTDHRSGRPRPPLRRCAPEGPLPLSPAQARLWFLYRLEGPSPTYNIPMALRFDGRLDVAALQAALADLAGRHETLRTVFPDRDGVATQVVLRAAEATPRLAVVDATDDTFDDIVESLGEHGFDLAVEPPVRAALVRLDSGDDVLSLVVHHIASDEASDEPLWHDLAAAYEARRAGRAPDWEPLAVTYRDYTVWQRELLGDPADPTSLAAEQAAFWRSTLNGAPEELRLPADRPRPAQPTMAGGAVPFTVPADIADRIAELSRTLGATPFMVAHAAVAGLLSRLGAGEDIPLGVPVAGRVDDALEGLVGFFVNTLVLRTDVSGDPTLRQMLARVRDSDLAALANQDLPFEMVVDAVAPTRSAARHPLFQVMISYQHGEGGALDAAALAARSRPTRPQPSSTCRSTSSKPSFPTRAAKSAEGSTALSATPPTSSTGTRRSAWPSGWCASSPGWWPTRTGRCPGTRSSTGRSGGPCSATGTIPARSRTRSRSPRHWRCRWPPGRRPWPWCWTANS